MSFKSQLAAHRSSSKTGAFITSLIGALLILIFPHSGPLRGFSFDLPFLFAPRAQVDDIVVIKMDDEAHRVLGQHYGKPWDRRIHASLLQRLQADEAKMAVFDVFLADPVPAADAEQDEIFTEAICQFKNVLLAAVPRPFSRKDFDLPVGFAEKDDLPPAKIFLSAVGNRYGLGAVYKDYDSVLRQHRPERREPFSLAWLAAIQQRPSLTNDPSVKSENRWIRYYHQLPTVSYADATHLPPRFFKDKVVFIGGQPTEFALGPADAFHTPFSVGGMTPFAGVDILATVFLNLIHKQWITHIGGGTEFVLIVLSGLLFGAWLACLPPVKGAVMAALSILAVAAAGVLCFWPLLR
jgi:CHASE2 domain-containing sensor protein